jgi:hypothetical protein
MATSLLLGPTSTAAAVKLRRRAKRRPQFGGGMVDLFGDFILRLSVLLSLDVLFFSSFVISAPITAITFDLPARTETNNAVTYIAIAPSFSLTN